MTLCRLGCLSTRRLPDESEAEGGQKADDGCSSSQPGSSSALIRKISLIFSSDADKISRMITGKLGFKGMAFEKLISMLEVKVPDLGEGLLPVVLEVPGVDIEVVLVDGERLRALGDARNKLLHL